MPLITDVVDNCDAHEDCGGRADFAVNETLDEYDVHDLCNVIDALNDCDILDNCDVYGDSDVHYFLDDKNVYDVCYVIGVLDDCGVCDIHDDPLESEAVRDVCNIPTFLQ
jgi:hypothetical protein